MIRSNTWREIRATTLLYVILLESLLAIAIWKWPTLRDNAQTLLPLKALFPADFMRRWIDGIVSEKGYDAYVAVQVFFKQINIVGIACACLYGTSIIARERENSTFELLLSRPLSRSRILLDKFVVAAAAIVIPIFVTTWTALPLSWWIGEDLAFGRVTIGAAYSSVYCLLFLALSTVFSVRLRTQVDVAFVVGAVLVFQVCIYFVPEIRAFSLFRLSDYDVYWPILTAHASAVTPFVRQGLWLLLAVAVLYGIADRLFRRAEP